MPSKRCSKCDVHWPQHHAQCPDCGGAVYANSNVAAISKDEYDRRMILIRYRKSGFKLSENVAVEVAEFERDWEAAEAIAATHALDVADLIVAARKKAA